MTQTPRYCDYCGLSFSGAGYSPDGKTHFCCYGCYLVQGIVSARGEEAIASWILIRLGIGAFFAMNVMMMSLVLYAESEAALGMQVVRALHWGLVILSTPAIIILGLPLTMAAIRSLKGGHLSLDLLIIVSSIIAYGVSTHNVILDKGHIYFDTATMLLLIITLGRLLEASAKSRTSSAVKNLMDLAPRTANVIRDGQEVQIPISEVKAGEVIRVRPGERIAVDGEITEGSCMVEESAFTGESRPRSCTPGDSVFGGSVDCDGLIYVKANAVGDQSMLAQVQRMIREAQDNRAPVERLAERVGSVFIPAIWLVAVCAGLYWWLAQGDPERAAMSALAVVVVACPCSLGLATPIAISLAVGIAAGKGVLVRSGEVLERLPQLRKVFFDKTGTLTHNNLVLSEIRVTSETTPNEALLWAASAEAGSEHSIARAIVDAAYQRGLPLGDAADTRIYPGQGLSARVASNNNEKLVYAGNWSFVSRCNTTADLQPSADAVYTTVYAAWDDVIKAEFTISDSLRPDAASVVRELKNMGINSTVISGDQDGPVRRTAKQAGIDDFISNCSIQDKVTAIKTARKAVAGGIGMIGDGINDAPALAEADVGFAVHGGTDLAKEAGSVVLLGDDLMRIPWLISLSRKTYHIIRQNLYWAFGYNLVAVFLSFMGYVHPLIAASAMFLSSLAVLSNSLRLLKCDSNSGDIVDGDI